MIRYLNAVKEIVVVVRADQEQDQGGLPWGAVHREDVHPHALHPRQIRGGTGAHRRNRLHGQKHPRRPQHPQDAALGHRRPGTVPFPHPQLPEGCPNRLHRLRPHKDQKSFENLNQWLDLCHNNKKDKTIIVLLGNKSDLHDARQVPPERIRTKLEEMALPYFQVSAKNGDNIKEAFHFAGNQYFNLHINTSELTLSTIGPDKTKHQVIPEEKIEHEQKANPSKGKSSKNSKKDSDPVKLGSKDKSTKKKKKCC